MFSSAFTSMEQEKATHSGSCGFSFGIQDQAQKFKCGKQTIYMIRMCTIIPTHLTPALEKMEIHLKYRKYTLLTSQIWSKCAQFLLPT